MDYQDPTQLTLGELINYPFQHIVSLLQQSPALVFDVDYHGRTLLHHAAEVGRGDVADYFIRAGTPVDRVDDAGRTPLHWAANYGNLDVIDLLLKAGASTEARDGEGWTPLRRANISRSGRSREAVELLLEGGAKPDDPSEW